MPWQRQRQWQQKQQQYTAIAAGILPNSIANCNIIKPPP